MKTLRNNIFTMFTAVLVLVPSISLADYKSDIITSCNVYQKGTDKSEINACKLYIDGFIDSSLLSESAAVLPKSMINEKAVKQSAYLKRAYQSWGFNGNSSSLAAVSYQFCIPLEYDRKQVASTVAKSLDIKKLQEQKLKVILLESLIMNFPCEKNK